MPGPWRILRRGRPSGVSLPGAARVTDRPVDSVKQGLFLQWFPEAGNQPCLIAQRDGQLQRLYAENAQLLQAQERGFTGQLLYLLKRVYVRYRR